ncbi:hypothetical protein B7494_g4907 [Chlorociboria aeruginascens]|nr:hypothetical protein B7494_g4907 [Chlorociboria aeruginascens]
MCLAKTSGTVCAQIKPPTAGTRYRVERNNDGDVAAAPQQSKIQIYTRSRPIERARQRGVFPPRKRPMAVAADPVSTFVCFRQGLGCSLSITREVAANTLRTASTPPPKAETQSLRESFLSAPTSTLDTIIDLFLLRRLRVISRTRSVDHLISSVSFGRKIHPQRAVVERTEA